MGASVPPRQWVSTRHGGEAGRKERTRERRPRRRKHKRVANREEQGKGKGTQEGEAREGNVVGVEASRLEWDPTDFQGEPKEPKDLPSQRSQV